MPGDVGDFSVNIGLGINFLAFVSQFVTLRDTLSYLDSSLLLLWKKYVGGCTPLIGAGKCMRMMPPHYLPFPITNGSRVCLHTAIAIHRNMALNKQYRFVQNLPLILVWIPEYAQNYSNIGVHA